MNFSQLDDDQLLPVEVVANWLCVSTSHLNKARMQIGKGPAFIKEGRTVRYRVGDVRQWIRDNRRRSVRVAFALSLAMDDSDDLEVTTEESLEWLGLGDGDAS